MKHQSPLHMNVEFGHYYRWQNELELDTETVKVIKVCLSDLGKGKLGKSRSFLDISRSFYELWHFSSCAGHSIPVPAYFKPVDSTRNWSTVSICQLEQTLRLWCVPIWDTDAIHDGSLVRSTADIGAGTCFQATGTRSIAGCRSQFGKSLGTLCLCDPLWSLCL